MKRTRVERLSQRARSGRLLATLAFSLALCTLSSASLAATVVVSPADMDGWAFRTPDPDPNTPANETTATAQFVNGPGTPPLGTGSAQLNVGSNGVSTAQIRNTNYAGTMLSELTALSYSTYVAQNLNGAQAPYLALYLDYNNDNTPDDVILFEPEYQHAYTSAVPDQGDLLLNTWQTWDALAGGWYSTIGTGGSGPGVGVKPLSFFFSTTPGTTIVNPQVAADWLSSRAAATQPQSISGATWTM